VKDMIIETIKNLFSKPATIKYPFEPSPTPPDYRGLIVYKEELCIFCTKCELVCPPGAIRFTYKEDGSKKYHYNPYLCIYCGECVRACPKPGCLTQVKEVAPPATKETKPDWNAVEVEAEESKKRWLVARKKKA